MRIPSTKECVGNVGEVEFSTNSKEKDMGKKNSYADIVIVEKKRGTIMS